MQNIKIIAISDIHFGVVPSSLGEGRFLEKYSSKKYSLQMQALDNVTQFVLDNNVDAVFIAGDILDSDSAYFEGFSALSKFLETINKNNVKVFAVSGNHDANLLKKLSLKDDNFILLGQNGLWEQEIFDLRDNKQISISAKSFISSHQTESHLASYKAKNKPNDIPSVGLIHADLGAANSDYAPSVVSEFDKTNEDIWICGHIHASKYYDGNKKLLIPGSLQGLDPSEKGLHGGYLIECEGSNIKNVKLIPFANAYYDEIIIDVNKESLFEESITNGLKKIGSQYKKEALQDSILSLRLTISVPYKLYKNVKALIDDMPDRYPINFGNIIVEKISLRSDYSKDLETLSKRKDPLGILANYLQVLETKTPIDKYNEYIQKSSKSIFKDLNQSSLSLLSTISDDEEKIRESLLKGGEVLMSKFIEELGLSND